MAYGTNLRLFSSVIIVYGAVKIWGHSNAVGILESVTGIVGLNSICTHCESAKCQSTPRHSRPNPYKMWLTGYLAQSSDILKMFNVRR